MRFDEWVSFDGLGLAALVHAGEVSADELLDTALAATEVTDEAIAAVVHVQEGVARAAIAAGLPDGPFTGVPFLLKDLGGEAMEFPTSMGSRLYADFRYDYDSELFVRLRATGLGTFARATSPEFGIGATTEANVYGRPTRNPWNRDHVAGGSSGGSAAAVAAGVVPMAHGSDGGGSVRIPASSCGLFGVKPTRALLPDGPAAGEGWAGMAIEGYLTRSVRDTAALLDATAGPDVGAPYYAPAIDGTFMDAIMRAPRQLRIALSTRSFTGDEIHPDCVAAVQHTAALCESLGHHLVPVEPSIDIRRFAHAWANIVACGTQLTVQARLAALGRPLADDDLERVTRLACELGETLSGADYIAAIDVVHAVGRQMAHWLGGPENKGYDVLLTTTLAEPPAIVGRMASGRADGWVDFLDYRLNHVLPYSPFTALANGTGQPAMSVPLWCNGAGLPVGSHFMAKAGDDLMLLQLAAQLEQADPWFHKRPPR